MTRHRTTVVALGVLALTPSCREQQAFVAPEPGLERMQEQPRVDPFAASTFFRDGLAMRRPPEGTVPVELVAEPSTAEDRLPIAVDRALLERGRGRFDVFCAACHGIGGDGQSVVAENMRLRKPPSLLEERIRALTFGRLYQIVSGGYGLMPAYSAQLSIEERWATVAYVRALQISRRSEVRTLPPEVRAELAQAQP